jgi:hypothetical protein
MVCLAPVKSLSLLALLAVVAGCGNINPSISLPQSTPPSASAATGSAGFSPDLVSPEPSVGQFLGGADEYLPRLAECLREAGWNAHVVNGALSVDFTPGQESAFRSVRSACVAKLGTPPTPAPYSEAEIRAEYAYEIQLRECLIGLGYAISEPPSAEEFIDSWLQPGQWTAYRDLPQGMPPAEWDHANQVCPQYADR